MGKVSVINIILNHKNIFLFFVATTVEPERRSGDGVLYRDGHYYKKDRRDKVSVPTPSSGNKNAKATGKPQKPILMDLEQSATGKPIHTNLKYGRY